MNLRQLRYFRAVAEAMSFARAAEALAVSQPTISTSLLQLEGELGARLFNRTTRSVELTEFGTQILPSVLDVLDAQSALVAKARALLDPERTLIRIGISPLVDMRLVNLTLEPILRGDQRAEVVFRQMNLLELYQALDKGKLDFIIGPEDPVSEPKPDWHVEPLYREPLWFLPRHGSSLALSGGKRVTLSAIAQETLVMAPDICGLARVTRALFGAQGLTPREYAGQALSYAILQEWAELGIGAAILPNSKISVTTNTAIPLVDDDDMPIKIGFRILWRKRQTPRIEAFRKRILHHAPAIAKGLSG